MVFRSRRPRRGNRAATAAFLKALKATSGSPLVEVSPLDISMHRLTASPTPRRVIDAKIWAQLRERHSGRPGFSPLARWPARAGRIRELRFLLWDVFLGGVSSRVRRPQGSLVLNRNGLHRD